jgi:hypothetical protein
MSQYHKINDENKVPGEKYRRRFAVLEVIFLQWRGLIGVNNINIK